MAQLAEEPKPKIDPGKFRDEEYRRWCEQMRVKQEANKYDSQRQA